VGSLAPRRFGGGGFGGGLEGTDESVQVDVKFGKGRAVGLPVHGDRRLHAVSRAAALHQTVSLAFLAEVGRALPFPIRKLQCDHGREFVFVETAGIRHRCIRPRSRNRT